jgi:outer membrane lipoprotein-sorting protein
MLALLSFALTVPAFSASNDATLIAWLNAQTNLHTWSADVTQTRSLKSLTQPLVAQGRVWFSAPKQFRWEIGEPATTIAVRQPEQMLVIYPRLKRAERYPLDGAQAGPWKDTLSLLEAGFPRSPAELEARFKVISQSETNGVHQVVLQPRSASARRLMPEIRIAFSTVDFALRATELHFADGSTLRNQFNHSQLNPSVDPALFEPKLESDYKLVDPMKR